MKSITYKDSGVDIRAGEHAVDIIKSITRSTFTDNVISDIGGFGGLFSMKGLGGDDPVLVSGTDGVGTKLKIAFMSGKHDTIGIDAVAMCVNDVICSGAKPLFFLDYLAMGKLYPEQVKDIINGIGDGCRQAGCALIGGEMAEMPGFYQDGEYDIAGFCVGVVDRSKIIDGSRIRTGDVLVGLPSSGLHSNGYSLVRKAIFELGGYKINDVIDELDGKTIGEVMLEPTKIYVKQIESAVNSGLVKGIAHITGGGLWGNIDRVIPDGLSFYIDWCAWKKPDVFQFIKKVGNISSKEIRQVFNCGIGMVLVVDNEGLDNILSMLDGDEIIIGRVI